MKIHRAFQISVLVTGLGAALLLAGPVRAQQDADPDTFDINPGTPKAEVVLASMPAPASGAQGAAIQESSVGSSVLTTASPKLAQELASPTAVDLAMAVILMVGTGLVAVYVISATRRERHRNPSAQRRAYISVSGATTH
jgi:hypothetical protein